MKRFQLTLVFVALMVGAIQIWACTIPVFRYALDRWHPDPYGVHVSEEWLKTDKGKQFAEQVQELSQLYQIVPGEEKEGEISVLQPAPGSPEVWRGKPDVKTLKEMLISPARKQIMEKIVNGASVVFVMVMTGDTKADSDLETKLNKRLGYLGEVMSIPPQDPFDPENKLGPGPALKVGFSTIKIQRNDPKEQFLVKMLAGQNGDELIKADQPFAAPIFGRGRALGAWKSEDLDDEGIDELCQFLLGACSCQVKAQNPGWDILIGSDWDEGLMKVGMALERAAAEAETVEPQAPSTIDAPAVVAAVTNSVPAPETNSTAPETVTFNSTPKPETTEAAAPKGVKLIPILLGFGAAIVVILAVMSGRRKS
ncbi:MAG: hypothetical protein ACPGVU_26775 [Limisphaerales bacterium]